MEVLQRFNWTGEPREIGDFFRLTKNRRMARAAIVTHQFGWEIRLLVGSQSEVVQSQVCRTQEEVFSTGEQWKAGMLERAWRNCDLGNRQEHCLTTNSGGTDVACATQAR
jgi:hypothetical protein